MYPSNEQEYQADLNAQGEAEAELEASYQRWKREASIRLLDEFYGSKPDENDVNALNYIELVEFVIEAESLREEVKRLRRGIQPKQGYSKAPSWDIKELDIIFAVREQEGTNYLYKSESGYHGFKDKPSEQDMDKGGFRLIWERGKE